MTVEEAIKVLQANYPDPCFEQLREACDMAITALRENQALKRRCMINSQGRLCTFCLMKCPRLGDGE